jgi:predicted secreted hydrolase
MSFSRFFLAFSQKPLANPITFWVSGFFLVLALGLGIGKILPEKAQAQSAAAASTGSLQKTSTSALAKDYRLALPGYSWSFPTDHGSHPSYKTEWWYYTGHLQEPNTPHKFGYQLTFFRSGSGIQSKALPQNSRWELPDVLAAHFALTDIYSRRFFYEERFGRPGDLLGAANPQKLDVWIRNWKATRLENGQHLLQGKTSDGKIALNLTLTPTKREILHGTNGLSQKAACQGCASHYYSLPRLQSKGTLVFEGKTYPLEGLSWMDHEFGSNQLSEKQVGWDWLSLHLSNGEDLMLYRMRLKDGTVDLNSSGTLVDAQGVVHHLNREDFEMEPLSKWSSPHSDGIYPMGWRVRIPSRNLRLLVTPELENQELVLKKNTGVTYWEGASAVSGDNGYDAVTGKGYVEMTGYAEPFNTKI